MSKFLIVSQKIPELGTRCHSSRMQRLGKIPQDFKSLVLGKEGEIILFYHRIWKDVWFSSRAWREACIISSFHRQSNGTGQRKC